MTNAELIVWLRLRRNAIHGQHFRRQHPIPPYVVDFACLAPRLVIEIDGATHSSDEGIRYDERREAFLRGRGFTVLRFWNREIYDNLDGVLEKIWSIVGERVRPR